MQALAWFLNQTIHNGDLMVIDADGARHHFGSDGRGPRSVVRFTERGAADRLLFNPEVAVAEAYMDGRLVPDEGTDVYDLLAVHAANRRRFHAHWPVRLLDSVSGLFRTFSQANSRSRAAANAVAHYDHPPEFYALWLDGQMNYSCAYYPRRQLSLEEAQLAKMRHIAAKLDISPGMRVLDVGSGWGALAFYLAEACGARVTGLALAPHQVAEARKGAIARGLEDRVQFHVQDYREAEGRYDRVVSVGMMEHVGIAYFDRYFSSLANLLEPDGIGLVHAIGRNRPPAAASAFFRKYIFPGGYAPSLSEVFASTERTGLWVADCEVLRMHYAWTLKDWRARFDAKRPQVVDMMGERFARMWEFYLSAAELFFRTGPNMVYQVLISKTLDAVPLTRDYVTAEEGRLENAGF
ncbi:MAG: cyclopropane-fatty-acyl-phospholipid synthase family protein [Pseudomonadota bacterium]